MQGRFRREFDEKILPILTMFHKVELSLVLTEEAESVRFEV